MIGKQVVNRWKTNRKQAGIDRVLPHDARNHRARIKNNSRDCGRCFWREKKEYWKQEKEANKRFSIPLCTFILKYAFEYFMKLWKTKRKSSENKP